RTEMILGYKSELTVDTFVFHQASGSGVMHLNMKKGTLRFSLSDRIDPEGIWIVTPSGVIRPQEKKSAAIIVIGEDGSTKVNSLSGNFTVGAKDCQAEADLALGEIVTVRNNCVVGMVSKGYVTTKQNVIDDGAVGGSGRQGGGGSGSSGGDSGGYGGGSGGGGGGSCFAAGTSIMMADGSMKNIEDIQVGELVIGQHGVVNQVTGLETPRLANRMLYSFNGGRPFITPEHPIMTGDGWKAVDPSGSWDENPRMAHIVVGPLRPGDGLAVAGPALGARGVPERGVVAAGLADDMELVTMDSVTGVKGDPEMTVYNLLLDGNHTYFADGYLVHNLR
ncbi:MAG: Hint domain-containing homing endonuclease, partial [Rhodospirillales bacterium]